MEQLAALAARHALPAIFTFREFALARSRCCVSSSRPDDVVFIPACTRHSLPTDDPLSVSTGLPCLSAGPQRARIATVRSSPARSQRTPAHGTAVRPAPRKFAASLDAREIDVAFDHEMVCMAC